MRALTLAVALTALVPAAWAAQYTVTTTLQGYSGGGFGANITNQTYQNTPFPIFDASKGTLVSASAAYTIHGQAFASLSHTDGDGNPVPVSHGSFDYSTQVDAFLFGPQTGYQPLGGQEASLAVSRHFEDDRPSASYGFSDAYAGSDTFDYQDAASLASLSDETNGPLMLEVDTSSGFAAYPGPGSYNDYNPVSSIPTVDLSVTYFYQPVPEPSTFSAVGASVILAFLRRRKRG